MWINLACHTHTYLVGNFADQVCKLLIRKMGVRENLLYSEGKKKTFAN
jgi:hypothetical protein